MTIEKRNRPPDSPFPAADDSERLDPILDELDAGPAIRERAYDVASVVEETMWVVGRSRATVAAIAVHVAGTIEGEGDPVFEQSEVAAASDASPAAISTHTGDLEAIYEQCRRRGCEGAGGRSADAP